MFSSKSASFSKNFVVLHSAAEAAAFFPDAKKILPVTEIYPANTPSPLFTSLIKKRTNAGKLALANQSLGAYEWYSPHLAAPPDCEVIASSCFSSSLSSTCAAPCITSTDWYWQDIDRDNEYEPDTDYIIEPARLPSTICPGDYITFNITPTSAAGNSLYGIPLKFSWSGVTPGQQSCFTLVSYSPGLQYNGYLNYPPPTAFDFGWDIYWGTSGGIYDPPYPKVTTYSVTVQYTGNCCGTNYNQTIGSFVLYGGDRDRYRVADVICCESVGSSIAVPYTVPGWRSNVTNCPPESCISIGGDGWLSPFTDSAPEGDCCGSQSSIIEEPIYYGPCDCGLETEAIRNNYQFNFDEPVPTYKPFRRPAGRPSAGGNQPYTDWIHSSRFHVAPKSTWTTTYSAPYFTGFTNINHTPNNNLPYGVDLSGLADPSLWITQYCWNEFDYEISHDVRVNSDIKPVFITGTGLSANQNWVHRYGLAYFISNIFNVPEVVLSLTCRGNNYSNFINPVSDHLLELRNDPSSFRQVTGYQNPPLQVLNFDQTYQIKLKVSCSPIVYPNHGTITAEWFLDGSRFLNTQFPSTVGPAFVWNNCTPNQPSAVWRALLCTSWSYQSFIQKFAYYNANPALHFYWDNFEFKVIPK